MPKHPSPYQGLPASAYWKTAVSLSAPLEPGSIYKPKFPIDKEMRIATAGSCFAQHVGRTLKTNGFNVIDVEPYVLGISDEVAHQFGYRLYSARYGNIYTARQLWQLIGEANGTRTLSHPIWEKDGRFFDAFRPSVEPDGLPSRRDVEGHRAGHLRAVRSMLKRIDLMVFTFGLTEAWACTADDTVYPTAPGTIAGEFDPEVFHFVNFSHSETMADFERVRDYMKSINPEIKFLVTVSPVPLTATATGLNVEVATSYSKSTLRSVCGELSGKYDDVDYFPSYEIITSQKARGTYYEPNLRGVSKIGVATAMAKFMEAHGHAEMSGDTPAKNPTKTGKSKDDVVCEESLLEAFAK